MNQLGYNQKCLLKMGELGETQVQKLKLKRLLTSILKHFLQHKWCHVFLAFP